MRWKQTGVRTGFVVLSLAFLLLTGPPEGRAQQMEKLTLKGTWVFTPNDAPFFVGLEKGFFAKEGIDLDFQDGRGSARNMQFLAAKSLLFGLTDLGTAAKFISEGAPVRAVYGHLRTSPMSVVAHADLGVRTPKDLQGKKLGRAVGDAGSVLFPAVATKNGVDVSKITFVSVTPAARNTALLNRDVDAIIAFFPDNAPFLRSKGAKVTVLRYADFGVNTLSHGLAVHESVLKEKPDILRRLLRAVGRSVLYTRDHPDEAIAALQKRAPVALKDPAIAREVLDNFLTLLHSKNTQGKPLGWMAKEDWESTVEILKTYGGLKNPLPPERYYTNDFIANEFM